MDIQKMELPELVGAACLVKNQHLWNGLAVLLWRTRYPTEPLTADGELMTWSEIYCAMEYGNDTHLFLTDMHAIFVNFSGGPAHYGPYHAYLAKKIISLKDRGDLIGMMDLLHFEMPTDACRNPDLNMIPKDSHISQLNEMYSLGYRQTSVTQGVWQPPTKISPIVLDLDGDGLETVGRTGADVYFDFNGDGLHHRTGWLSGDDGFLVYDRNEDGIINDGRELFGNNTTRYRGGTCVDGYEALAQEDTNCDGFLDHNDYNWSRFQLGGI